MFIFLSFKSVCSFQIIHRTPSKMTLWGNEGWKKRKQTTYFEILLDLWCDALNSQRDHAKQIHKIPTKTKKWWFLALKFFSILSIFWSLNSLLLVIELKMTHTDTKLLLKSSHMSQWAWTTRIKVCYSCWHDWLSSAHQLILTCSVWSIRPVQRGGSSWGLHGTGRA